MFALWKHREETLKMLLEHLNLAHPTIKFTAEWSRERVNFLDVTVKLEHGICRGYDISKVQQQIDRATHISRAETLTPREGSRQNKRTPPVVSYHPNLPT